jgi:hypothetical protein
VRIHQVPDVLGDTLSDEQNRNVFSGFCKLEKSFFNLPLIGGRLVTDVKVCALATRALPDAWRKQSRVKTSKHPESELPSNNNEHNRSRGRRLAAACSAPTCNQEASHRVLVPHNSHGVSSG